MAASIEKTEPEREGSLFVAQLGGSQFPERAAKPRGRGRSATIGRKSRIVLLHSGRYEATKRWEEGGMRIRLLSACAALIVSMAGTAVVAAAPARALDYNFFKARVQPIFLENRPGHARCVVCHAGANNALHLAPVPASGQWSEEDTKNNFAAVSALVNANDPANSRLLIHPLAPEAGGDLFHSGGRQFASKDDPDWKALAQFAGVK
jgi:hypothetical protein